MAQLLAGGPGPASVSMRSRARPFWQAHEDDFNFSTHETFQDIHRNPGASGARTLCAGVEASCTRIGGITGRLEGCKLCHYQTGVHREYDAVTPCCKLGAAKIGTSVSPAWREQPGALSWVSLTSPRGAEPRSARLVRVSERLAGHGLSPRVSSSEQCSFSTFSWQHFW